MSTPTLNRTECNALRGLAIIGIFLHNYCHWLGPIVKENEYQYIQRNVDWLHQVMASPDGWLPMHLLSFFGHYGVPVFLFLSAYGLVLKYESGPRLTQGAERFSITGRHLPNLGEGLRFVRYHYLKLFKMMIVGFVAFTMLDYLTPGPHHYQSLDIIAMLGMFNNVLPNPDRIIWPGPFWFFGLMLQLYIIYRLFIYRRHWAFTVVLMVVCLALQLCLSPDGEAMNRYRYNFMGGMLPFGIGILYARYGEKILMTFHHNTTNAFGIIFCGAIIYSLSGSMLDLRASLRLSVLRPGSKGAERSEMAAGSIQISRLDGRNIGSTLRLPSYHPQDIHPHQPLGRHVRRTAALHHIEHLLSMALL